MCTFMRSHFGPCTCAYSVFTLHPLLACHDADDLVGYGFPCAHGGVTPQANRFPPSNPVASDCEQKQLTLDEVFEIQAFVRQVKIEHAGMELADYQSTPLRDWSSEDHFDWWCYHHRRCARHRALCRASMAPRCC